MPVIPILAPVDPETSLLSPVPFGTFSLAACAAAILFIAVLRRRSMKRRLLQQHEHRLPTDAKIAYAHPRKRRRSSIQDVPQNFKEKIKQQSPQRAGRRELLLCEPLNSSIPTPKRRVSGAVELQLRESPGLPPRNATGMPPMKAYAPHPSLLQFSHFPCPVPASSQHLLRTDPTTYRPYQNSQILADYGPNPPLPGRDPELTPLDGPNSRSAMIMDEELAAVCLSRAYSMPVTSNALPSSGSGQPTPGGLNRSATDGPTLVHHSGQIILGPGFRRHIKVFRSVQ